MRVLSVLFGVVLGMSMLAGCTVCVAQSDVTLPYPQTPSFATDPFFPGQDGGDFGTGLALADINGDGYKDMVVSSGNDKALQHVTVYLNQGDGSFPQDPDWISGDTDHHGTLAVGDVDGDGDNDVAVSVFLGTNLAYEGGGVKVYYNQGGTLESMPSFQVTGYPSFGCALGDINGDGRLDLAVACGEPIPEVESFATQECTTKAKALRSGKAADNPQPPYKVQNRIYLNQGGSFSTAVDAVWLTADSFVAMAATFGDVNQDGLMDVIFDSAPVRVYLGRQDDLPLTDPDWTSEDENYYGNGIDFAPTIHQKPAEPDTVPTIAASGNSYMGKGRGGFAAYRFLDPFIIQYEPRTSQPIWQSKYGGWGSAIRLADVNADGNLDILTHRWNPPGRNELAGTLLVYLGNGSTYPETWDWSSSSDYTSIIEAIDLADLSRSGLSEVTFESGVDDTRFIGEQNGMNVFYVGPQIVERVLSVEWFSQAAGWTTLTPAQYAVVPGRGWVSLGVTLHVGNRVRVVYEVSPELDISYSTWNCDQGNYIYYYQ